MILKISIGAIVVVLIAILFVFGRASSPSSSPTGSTDAASTQHQPETHIEFGRVVAGPADTHQPETHIAPEQTRDKAPMTEREYLRSYKDIIYSMRRDNYRQLANCDDAFNQDDLDACARSLADAQLSVETAIRKINALPALPCARGLPATASRILGVRNDRFREARGAALRHYAAGTRAGIQTADEMSSGLADVEQGLETLLLVEHANPRALLTR